LAYNFLIDTSSSIPQTDLKDWRTLVSNFVAGVLFYVIGTAMMNTKGLEDELGFYGSYHAHPVNQLIHFIFIPCIWWSICVFLCYVPFLPLSLIGVGSVGGHAITWGTLQFLIYSAFYISLDAAAGGITAALLAAFYLQASSVVAKERAFKEAAKGKDKPGKKKLKLLGETRMSWFKFAFILHALAWYMQIHPGHKIFEGVKPALMDSLGQALGVAPMFAFLEGVWFVGVLPEMKVRVQELVETNRQTMCDEGRPMPWCVN
jgi:uncharacterized membrane protein YGL010W